MLMAICWEQWLLPRDRDLWSKQENSVGAGFTSWTNSHEVSRNSWNERCRAIGADP
jgi:hypothetical protein